jgi:hypothetical protein
MASPNQWFGSLCGLRAGGVTLKHVPKQQWLGCAVAAAAMLSGRSYEDVAAHWADLDEARTRSPGELIALLEAVTDTEWHFAPLWHPQPRVREFVPVPRPVAVWIQDAALRPRNGQWVVVKGEVVYDPGEPTAHPVSRYPLRDWVVILVARPGPPEELVRLRERRRMRERRSVEQA